MRQPTEHVITVNDCSWDFLAAHYSPGCACLLALQPICSDLHLDGGIRRQLETNNKKIVQPVC